MSEEDLERFVEVCPLRSYSKGERIFFAGDPAEQLHIVVEGQVKLSRLNAQGSERLLAICAKNDFIGEAFLSSAARYRADAVALTDVTTCPVSREQFMRLIRIPLNSRSLKKGFNDLPYRSIRIFFLLAPLELIYESTGIGMMLEVPSFIVTFTQILAVRVFYCHEQLVQSYDPVRTRVIKTLLEQARRFGEPQTDGWVTLDTELKHEDIASTIAATRVSVSMALAELRERGVFEGSRGRYRLNIEGLSSLAEHEAEGGAEL